MKSSILSFAFCVFTLTSFGQIDFGIRGGFQPTNARTNTNEECKWRSSYFASIYGNFPFSKRISATAELLYADKGQKRSYSDFYNPNIFYHRTYLNIPILIQYHFNPKLSFQAGGEVGFLLASYAKQLDRKIDTRKYYGNALDFGLAAGTSYQIDSRCSVALRYVHGLSNVLGKDANIHFNNGGSFDIYVDARKAGQKYYNRSIQVSLSYSLHKLKSTKVKEDSSKTHISFGLKSGLNLNSTRHENYFLYPYEKDEMAFGGHLGVYMSIDFSEKMSFIPEIQFIKKGYKHSMPSYYGYSDSYARNTISIYYIELPLILSYAASKIVSIDVGPVFGERVLVTEKIKNRADPRKQYYNKNKSEFGLMAGLCFNVYERYSAAIRYYHGMSNISNLNDNNYTSEYNESIQISSYYRLSK
jgi:hypothetical protein